MHIYKLNRNRSPLKISGKVAVIPENFQGTLHRAHRTVIFAIAQLTCSIVCIV